MTGNLLHAQGVSAGYRGGTVLHDVSLEIAAGEAVSVVGANGAAKSTLLRVLAGWHPASAGQVFFQGEDITHRSAHARVASGLAMVPEGRRLFPSMTVEENLQVAADGNRQGYWTLETIYRTFPLVADRRARIARHLSGGEQQAVAIARALLTNPAVLLLDEISLGLAPRIVGELYQALQRIREQGVALLIVEQDITLALRTATRFYCLLEGRVVLAGAPGDYGREAISAAYFGTSGRAAVKEIH